MNENKRILLLALGIMAIVASDPPVATYFERPQSVCSMVAGLAVGAFDSLVRSTLPLPNTDNEFEQSDEILVADEPTVSPDIASPGDSVLSVAAVPPASSQMAGRSGDVVTTSAVPVLVQSTCAGREGTSMTVLKVEAVMEVSASAISHS